MRYRAHGLTISSDRVIPELVECANEGAPDVEIHFGTLPASDAELGEALPWFESRYTTPAGKPDLSATRRAGGRWLQFAYPDGTTFLVDARGTAIWAHWSTALSFAGVCEYLLGPILGIVLRVRGVVCLHASAVAIGGQAAAFLGPPGAGKSTLAATFSRAGFPVVSDDTIVVTARHSSWFVAPAYPRVRLWPDAVSALGLSADQVVAPDTDDEGTRYQLDLASSGLFARESVPVAAIYLIEFEEGLARPRLGAVRPAEMLPILSANTFASRVLDRERRAQEFNTLADLLVSVPVRRLSRAPNLGELARVRDTILNDIAASVR